MEAGPQGLAVAEGTSASIDSGVLRRRVRLYLKVLFWMNLAFVAVSAIGPVFGLQPSARADSQSIEDVGGLVLLVGMGAAWWWTARGRPSRWALLAIESVGTLAVIALYAYLVTLAPDPRARYYILPLTSFALMLRAALVPSGWGRTVVIGLVGVIITTVASSEMATVQELNETVWTITMGLALVAVTAVASSVIFGLRKAVRSAQRLGQYELTRKLGEGGMGMVFEGTHVLLRRPTAIKVLKPDLAGAETIDRFAREVRQTSRLEHPNSVYIYDYGRTGDGQFYYAMEYLDGVNLSELVELDGPLHQGRTAHIIRQAALALAEAHDMGLVHRDIKPANIMLCHRGGVADTAKVLDFGLVKVETDDVDLTRADSIIGTPHYLAPEAMRDRAEVGPPADIYALGATAYFLLCGQPVFDGGSVVEICARHLTDAPPPLAKRTEREVSPQLEAVVLRCLEKEPADRFADGRALARALAELGPLGWTPQMAEAWWTDAPTADSTGGTDDRSQLDIDLGARS